MWREKTLQVYFSNRKTKAGITGVVIFVTVVLNVNLILNKVKPSVEDVLSRSSGRNISIQRILFFEPHKLILKGVDISKSSKLGMEKKIFLSKVVFTFSIYKMFLERKISISQIKIVDPIIYEKKVLFSMVN